MDFAVRTRVEGRDAVLSVDGEIDLTSCGRLREELDAAGTLDTDHVVIDLTQVGFIDSTGLGVLVDGARKAHDTGRSFGVVADGHLRELLRMTGVDTVMAVHRHLDEAVGGQAPSPWERSD